MRRGEAGFTLIELLVVMLILALVSSVIVMNAPAARSSAQKDAEIFAAKLRLASETAIVAGAPVRLVIDNRAYGFSRYADGEWRETSLGAKTAAPALSPSTRFSVNFGDDVFANARALGGAEAQEENGVRRLAIDPIGATTPATFEFAGRRGAWTVTLSAAGDVSMSRTNG